MDCTVEMTDDGAVCMTHGGAWTPSGCVTMAVLAEVAGHREFQFANYGASRDVPDGTGPDVEWLEPVVDEASTRESPGLQRPHLTAREITELFRGEWDYPKGPETPEQVEARDAATWLRMVREEVAEAFEQDDTERLDEELTQVAALCVSWKERLRERRLWQYGHRRDDGTVYALDHWHTPAAVYRDQQGVVGPDEVVRVARRHPGGEWEDLS